MTDQEWAERELLEVMRIAAPDKDEDAIIRAIKLSAIRRLAEADEERYIALVRKYQ